MVSVFQDYAPLVLSTDTVVDVEMWMEQVHLATQKLTLDSLNLDMTNSLEYEANKSKWNSEFKAEPGSMRGTKISDFFM